ncbi:MULTISPECIES: hypothetical protein [Nocardiopsis]|uniref:DUF1876 domain-containing protein n=1 Tax=Nocardiopsis lambiniae TaxID=3075539 RepID=A0ABU2M343_9ACTN|nr:MULTISPECIES: hypothetical protein [unclassified Nocardiopsis]MDE3725011.1 hypothetical protein [Nocardiopsis sp. N85]MDT0327060.1 hypothetical protein [Nocardiopsis sp. DSM 44743]
MNATTVVTVTDLTEDDVRLTHDLVNGSAMSLVVAGCYIDVTPTVVRTDDPDERIAALERLADLAVSAAAELRRARIREVRQ